MKYALGFAPAGLLATASPAFAQGIVSPGTPALPSTITEDADDDMQTAAAVVKLTELSRQGDHTVKLFGTAGGDPAMNGLYTYIAFWRSVPDGWRVFKLGDFLDYRIVSEARGRVVLEIQESTMNEASGNIGSRRRRIALSWRNPASGDAPEAVSVAAAR